jgi:pimeloyl-ACP methyl ester carboxylesterase
MTTYKTAEVRGLNHFYREAGPKDAPTIVLLHGFPSSSHMYRDLIPMLADKFHLIAPDYVGFGFSAMPSVKEFEYTFDNQAAYIEELLLSTLGLKSFSIYVQDYGAPIGFRIASKNPQAIEGIIAQNGNAYLDGIGPGFDAIKPLWKNRNPETEAATRELLTLKTTKFQYVNGVKDESKISPDSYHFDQLFLDRPGNDAIQVSLLYDYQNNLKLYDAWHAYFKKHQPRTLITWGTNDVFFPVAGAKAYLRDLPKAELHLIETGHFALEDNCDFIAQRIRNFFA